MNEVKDHLRLGEVIKLTIFLVTIGADARAVESDGNDDANSDPSFLTFQNIILSLSVLCALVLVVFGCTWAWWRQTFCFWRKGGTHEAPPEWFVPGSANYSEDFRTLDPSRLPTDFGPRSSVTIPSLPTLSELGLEGRDSFELRTFRTPGIIAVAANANAEEPNVDDWFDESRKSFPRQNLEYQKLVGKGWFGKILEAEALNIKQYIRASNVVVRELRGNATDGEAKRFLDEARMFREAGGSDHILKLLGFCVDQHPYILIFEYFPLGDLKTYLRGKARQTPGSLTPGEDGILIRMIIDVIRGVKWMQQAGFVHGDLAARNCLVATPAGKVVIGDYGCSVQKYKTDYYWTTGRAIPIRWTAPETISFVTDDETHFEMSEVTTSANIWSLAVIIWEIFQLGKTPYENLTDEDVIRKVIKQRSYILEPPNLPFLKDTTKDKIYQILVACWNSVPNHRPAIEIIEQGFTSPL